MLDVLWLLRIIGFLLLGTYFLATGLWPKRRGTDPHCRKCGYNLANRAGDRCPECGVATGPKTIAIGQRVRKSWRIAAGWIALGIAGAFMAIAAYRLFSGNLWYSRQSTARILREANSADAQAAQRAFDELVRRYNGQEIAAADLGAFADLLLAGQADGSRRAPLLRSHLDCLWDLHQRNRLSPEQRRRYIAQLDRVILEAPPFAQEGMPFTVRLSRPSQSRQGFTIVGEWTAVLCDARELPNWEPRRWGGGDGRVWPNPEATLQIAERGEHELTALVRIWATESEPAENRADPQTHFAERKLTAPLRILDAAAYEQELLKTLQDCVKIKEITRSEMQRLKIHFQITRALPIDAKLEAALLLGAETEPLGQINVPGGAVRELVLKRQVRAIPQSANLSVRLVTGEVVGNQDRTKLAGHEYLFKNVPVRPEMAADERQ